jgi:hypothetical protein
MPPGLVMRPGAMASKQERLMQDTERLTARGEFEEACDRRQAVIVEMAALIEELHRRIPRLRDAETERFKAINPQSAVPLLTRLCELHEEFGTMDERLTSLSAAWGFYRRG